VLSDLTLTAIQAEATRAHLLHAEHSMLGSIYTSAQRLAILAEEGGEVSGAVASYTLHMLMALNAGTHLMQDAIGRVAHELTYDSGGPSVGEGRRDELVKELIQVAAMAATWVEHLEGGHSRV
jgi:hypothetical protein